jgi:trigger factor
MMADETKTSAGAAAATEESPETERAEHEHDRDHDRDRESEDDKTIRLGRDLLTAEAKQKAEEESGKPIADIAYEIVGEEALPHSTIALKLRVAAEPFAKEVERFYSDLRKDVSLPGFRKGKAPIKLIRIRMGEEADRDAVTEVALNVVRQELSKRDLKPLEDPKVAEWKMAEGEPLDFEVRFDVEPKVELKEYKGLSVEVEARDITDEDIEQELLNLRQEHAAQEVAPAGTGYEPGMTLAVDLTVTGDKGQELRHLSKTNHLIEDPKVDLPEEFGDKLLGAKVGDEIVAEIKNAQTNRRGETTEHVDTYTVKVRELKVQSMPDLDDEFAKDLGEHNTLDELRAAIRADLEKSVAERFRRASIGRVIGAIVEKNPVDPPLSTIAAVQLELMVKESYRLSRFGLRLQDVVRDSGQYFKQSNDAAEFWVRQELLTKELRKVEGLEVSDEDVEKEIARLAEEAGRTPLAIRARLEANKQLDELRESLARRKMEDFLLECNTVTRIAPKEEPERSEEASEAPKSEAAAADKG